ncbi:sperm-associated antigen 1 [Phlebotomus argentipes]|uniref:sperm-associated antigen 1 n=1 Tax=Phlebotomus argentipes TaxID=94469 RepID=UPI0028935471|nr:sperm-associated antigen 1 [Phlebotomus argentipes]
MVKQGKKTLLEKWDIPVHHLDFDYVKQCTNTKELERICLILQSGEEGFYPDLTKCAEERLKCLKPNSKILRTESPMIKSSELDQETSREISRNLANWSVRAKKTEEDVKKVKNLEIEYPPVRQHIESSVESSKKKSTDRIKSYEYQKWDQYDADAEALKLDLQEEIQKEKIEREKSLKENKKVIIEEIADHISSKLTTIEREELALKYKIKGNEYFKTSDFLEAYQEYTKSIEMLPNAVGYNNRAIAAIKLGRLKEATDDCDECLKLEPKNVKALLRKAQALQLDDCKRSAYEVLQRVLEIDPENAIALKSIEKLKKEIPPPPAGAFRIKIEEEPEEDFSKLIIPNKIVKNNMSTVAQSIGKLCGRATKKRKEGQTTHDKADILTPLCSVDACESRGAIIEEIFD